MRCLHIRATNKWKICKKCGKSVRVKQGGLLSTIAGIIIGIVTCVSRLIEIYWLDEFIERLQFPRLLILIPLRLLFVCVLFLLAIRFLPLVEIAEPDKVMKDEREEDNSTKED